MIAGSWGGEEVIFPGKRELVAALNLWYNYQKTEGIKMKEYKILRVVQTRRG